MTIYSYGLMLALAFLVGARLLAVELGRRGLERDLAGTVMFWAAVGGIIGARIYYIVLNWQQLTGDLLAATFSSTGLVWYGGLLGGVAASVLVLRLKRVPVLTVMDAAAAPLALAYGIGRIGCLLAGDGDYGPPSDLPWAMAFPNGTVPTVQPVHPTPLYETLAALPIFALLWRLRRRPAPAGWLFACFLVLQGLERFVVEFWRINPAVLWGLSDAQLFGLAGVVLGGLWLWFLRGVQPAPGQAPSSLT